jgi:hypothetical protein
MIESQHWGVEGSTAFLGRVDGGGEVEVGGGTYR